MIIISFDIYFNWKKNRSPSSNATFSITVFICKKINNKYVDREQCNVYTVKIYVK